MTPTRSSQDRTNVGVMYAITFANVRRRESKPMQQSNYGNISFGKFGLALALSIAVTIFALHIGEVLSLRSDPEVRRIYASPMVASMQNASSMWDFSVRESPRDPVNFEQLAGDHKIAVPTSGYIARPFPAISPRTMTRGFVNGPPQSLGYSAMFTRHEFHLPRDSRLTEPSGGLGMRPPFADQASWTSESIT